MQNVLCSSPSFIDESSRSKGNDNGSAIVEACESDLAATFWTDRGVAFKNEFCALCNFFVNINVWRNCRDGETKLSVSHTELTMLFSFKDTLLETGDTIIEPQLACATLEDVSKVTLEHYIYLENFFLYSMH